MDDPRITLLRHANVPVVLLGRSPDPSERAWHDVLGEDAMQEAVHHLAKLGHRRIGFINGGAQYNYAVLRLQGFRAGMAEASLPCYPEHIMSGALTPESGDIACRKMLTTAVPPTAIVCSVDVAALGVCRAAAELGLAIGSDLSVISYDGIPEGTHVKPELTTFAVDHTSSGRGLSNLLIRRINGENIETLRELVPATLKDRGSAGRPSLTSAQLAEMVARSL